jgi:hypothetical protein
MTYTARPDDSKIVIYGANDVPLATYGVPTPSNDASYVEVLANDGWTVTGPNTGGGLIVSPIDESDAVEAGAQALWAQHPYLQEDFTFSWFRKISRTVLEAGVGER